MILRCKGMCWEQCSQMCEAEWTHAVKSFMRGQTTASEPSLRFSCNSQLTLMLLSAVLYPKFEDISWDMWLFHSSDSSNHLPTERPSFCNWYGKYHPDTYEPDKGRLHLCWTSVFQCWAATHGGWTQYTCVPPDVKRSLWNAWRQGKGRLWGLLKTTKWPQKLDYNRRANKDKNGSRRQWMRKDQTPPKSEPKTTKNATKPEAENWRDVAYGTL